MCEKETTKKLKKDTHEPYPERVSVEEGVFHYKRKGGINPKKKAEKLSQLQGNHFTPTNFSGKTGKTAMRTQSHSRICASRPLPSPLLYADTSIRAEQ